MRWICTVLLFVSSYKQKIWSHFRYVYEWTVDDFASTIYSVYQV